MEPRLVHQRPVCSPTWRGTRQDLIGDRFAPYSTGLPQSTLRRNGAFSTFPPGFRASGS